MGNSITKITSPTHGLTSKVVTGVTKNSFVTDTPNISFKVIDDKGFQTAHYLINSINSFDLDGNKISIYTNDSDDVLYIFNTVQDAEIINELLNSYINGN